MQAKDLIVLGSSRLLGKLYCGDIDIGGSANISTISSALSLTDTTDSSSTTTGALKVSGGVGIAKKLYVGGNTYHSGSTYFGSTYNISSSGQATLSQVKVGTGSGDTTITNNSATIANITSTEIKATNVNVTNKLYALKYDLESVADLGGSFIVAPTLIVPNSTQATDSNASLTVAKSGNTLTLTIKDPSISTNQIAGFTWTQNYKVKVSGKISNTAIGTCTGKITSTNLSSTQMTLSVTCDSNIASQITTGSYQIANYNLNIMLYNADTSASGETLPIGIWLQSYGLTKNPTIEIWNGASTIPKVRLGYLNGIVYDKIDSTTNPNGLNQTLGNIWGLYADNAYLEGRIVAKGGRIGGWTIGDEYITTNSNRTTYDSTSATGMTMTSSGIGAYASASAKFTLSTAGVLTATGADITGAIKATSGFIGQNATNGFTISNTAIYNPSTKTTFANTSVDGVYIGKDGIALGKGKFTVSNAGALTATSGTISGWNITTNAFQKLVNSNWGVEGSAMLCTGSTGTKSIGGSPSSTSGWVLTAGANFGVTNTGALYCNSATISGALTATSLTINSGATISGDGASQILNSEIEIGGRNLLLNTAVSTSNISKIRANTSYTSVVTEDGIICYKITGSSTAHLFNGTDAWDCMAEKLKANTTYTYSAWIKSSKGGTLSHTFLGHYNVSNSASTASDKTHEDTNRIYYPETIVANTWTKISVTFTTNSLVGSSFGVYPVYNTGSDTILYIYGFMLEEGNKATDWTPAPEDVEVDIYEASTKATSYITYVSATEGIKIHNSGDTTDYVQVNSSAIKMYRNNVEKMLLDDASFRIGSIGSNKRNLYITDSAVQIRNNTIVLAEYGETTKFYDGNGVADSNIAAQIGADGLDIIKGHIGDWMIESGDIKYSAGVNETSPTISLTKQSTSNLRSIASIDASSSSETNPNSGARISVFYESYNSSTQTWQGDFAGCYIIPDKISLLSIQGRSLIEPNTISVGGSSPTSTIESVSTGGGAFIQANSAASEADIKAMSGGGTVYIYSSNNGNRGMYGTNSSNTGHSIIDVTNTNASYFRGQATSVSDLKKKDVIEGYDWKVDEFISGLKPIAFRRIHDDGTLGDRIRMGFGAQDIRDLTRSLYDEELSLYQAKIIDNVKEGIERESLDYHGEYVDDNNLSWSLAYEELIAPMVLELQRLMARVDKLEKELQNK